MSNRDILINAYNFYHRTPESAGDGDLGARGGRITKRRSKNPQHAKQSKSKAINTTNLIANALQAGKIIAAAERGQRHVGAYSRIYYGHSLRGDSSLLYGYLAGVVLKRLQGKIEHLHKGHNLIVSYATNTTVDPGEIDSNQEVDQIITRLIHSLDSGVLSRVGKELSNT